MIIEDNSTNMELMEYLLTAFGHTAIPAADGEAGLAAARAYQPQLIICDVHLPKLDGFGVARACKDDPALREIPILAVTALAMVGDRERLLDAGFDGYISKPIEPDSFISQLAAYLPELVAAPPVAAADPAAAPAAPPSEHHSATILIVDDHVLNRDFLRTLLSYSGHRILEAVDGEAALALLQDELPDLIISDILMPKMDGYEFVMHLRLDARLANVPIIFYTATYREREAKLLADACGVRWVLPKPSEPELLLHTVHEALGMRDPDLSPAVEEAPGDTDSAVRKAIDSTVAGYLGAARSTRELLSQAVHEAPLPEADMMTEQLAESLSSLQAVSLRLTALIELGIQLGSAREVAGLLDIGCKVAQDVCVARLAVVGVFSADGSTIEHLSSRGERGRVQGVRDAPHAGVLQNILRDGQPVRASGLDGDPRGLGFDAEHPPIHSFLGVPVGSHDKRHGWLYLVDKVGAAEFSEVDERIAVTVAAQLAVAYENLLLLDEIRQNHEQLTADMAARIRLDEDLLRFRTAMDATADAIFLIDFGQQRFIDVNQAASAMLGFERAAFHSVPLAAPLDDLMRKLLTGDPNGAVTELMLTRADGGSLAVEVQRRSLRSGQGWILVAVARDITERKEAEQRLLKLAHFDTLTGLPNRSQFYEALNRAIEQAREHGWALAVLFLDMDRFKTVNDTLGHAVGDELLREFSNRLVDCLRLRDTIGRFGGDEFAAILMLPDGAQNAIAVIDKIRETMRAPFVLKGHELNVTVSIGVTVFPDDAHDADTLIQYADTAMYRAKEAGRDAFRFFTAEMNAQSLARLDMENALRRAIEHEEFVLYYQPKVHIGTGRISGAEVLLRWQRPGHGMVSPALFIPILEETGLIVKVGTWVLHQACRKIAEWGQGPVGDVNLSVNVSGVQFFVGGLEQEVRRALQTHAIAPELLELELTESSLMSNAEETISVLNNLKALGVGISVDDFGTGYSSLAYLKRFPIDKLKIDIAFVREVTSNPEDAAIVLAIINMAHSLKLNVVAEGVEKDAQLAYLRRHQCDEMQGFYFSRPVPAEVFEQMLCEGRRLEAPQDEAELAPQQTLLIVDDDPFMLQSLSDFLAQDGYRILTAETAAEGFDLLARNRVQVILCDQVMPMMSGTEFMERVKNLAPDTFRIMLSAYADLTPIMAAINHGAVDRFYTKPWKGAVLRENIREGFRLHEQLYGRRGG
nr:EAL domain-containing protein [Massilia sp. TS11]